MKYLMIAFMIGINAHLIFDFNYKSNLEDWRVVDDVVMGGKSSGKFKLSPDGYGVFEGNISLANNGGFSSVRHQFKQIKVNKSSKIILRIKGDGKKYQFRVKDKLDNYYSYITDFKTTGEWQNLEISLKSMYPSFRGRRLDLPNFSQNHIEEITFLVANKKNENFKLLIDIIELI